MRLEVFISNSIKGLILKIPVARVLFFKAETFIFDVLKFLDLRRYLGKKFKPPISGNEKLILKFKKFYERNYFDEKINNIITYTEKKIRSAWNGHHYFALWLVKELKPTTIVDLGVDKGFSTFMFAAQKMGRVYGIDTFMGENLNRWKTEDYIPCMRNKRKMEKKFGIHNVIIIKGRFSDVVEKWKIPIDILHIDGTHVYEDVKEDYQNWGKFLNENSVILFHDTEIYEGVSRFFKEVELPKYHFPHSYGLGVLSYNQELISNIKEIWDRVN